MGKTLNLTKPETLIKLNELLRSMSHKTNISYTAETNVTIEKARTISDKNCYPQKVEIGTNQIDNAKLTIFNQPLSYISKLNSVQNFIHIPDEDFAMAIINIQHEYAHYIQQTKTFRKTDLTHNEQHRLLHTLACINNQEYYEENYLHDADEIQAEQYGINAAYKYLCQTFPNINPQKHEQIILSVINSKMHNPGYFIKYYSDFTSLDEINTAFSKAYTNSFTIGRNFTVNQYPDDNPMKVFMHEHKESAGACKLAKNSFDIDKCLATINMEIHKDSSDWLHCFPALKSMNLDYENNIYKPGKIAIRNPVQRQEDEINMQLGKIPPDDEFLEKQEKQKQQYELAAQELLSNMSPPSPDKNDYTICS